MSSTKQEHDVLLAEDDTEDVEIFGWAMHQAQIPHTLRHAENGDKLFVLLKEKIPYILFLDIKMPCKDGMSCIMEIRKNREYDKLPVIMYTSFMYPNYVEDSYRNGANYFMNKSASVDGIVQNLKKVFSIDWHNYQHYPMRDQFVIS